MPLWSDVKPISTWALCSSASKCFGIAHPTRFSSLLSVFTWISRLQMYPALFFNVSHQRASVCLPQHDPVGSWAPNCNLKMILSREIIVNQWWKVTHNPCDWKFTSTKCWQILYIKNLCYVEFSFLIRLHPTPPLSWVNSSWVKNTSPWDLRDELFQGCWDGVSERDQQGLSFRNENRRKFC